MDKVMLAFKNEKSLWDEIKSIFDIFKGLSLNEKKPIFFKGKNPN